jgi:hypothetical protein
MKTHLDHLSLADKGNPRPQKLCAFEGCGKTSERPGADGWTELFESGASDGLYCPEHAAALEQCAVRPEPEFPFAAQ